MSGVAIATSRAISPSWLAPISTTRYSVLSSTRSIEIGAPTWLLNEPCGRDRRPLGLEHGAQQVLGGRLAVGTGDRRRSAAFRAARTRATTRRAIAASAATPSATIELRHVDARRARSATTSAAPASTAAGANRCPSVSSPGRAKNTEPAPTRRESVSTVPDDDRVVGRRRRAGAGCRRAPARARRG